MFVHIIAAPLAIGTNVVVYRETDCKSDCAFQSLHKQKTPAARCSMLHARCTVIEAELNSVILTPTRLCTVRMRLALGGLGIQFTTKVKVNNDLIDLVKNDL